MKKSIGIFAVILMFTVSCSKEGLRSDLDKSYDNWEDFKDAANNTYLYTATTSSWVGSSSATTIVVKNGVVSERLYKTYETDLSMGSKKLVKSWSEDKASLNTHQEGAETLTIDQIYEKAKNVWLKVDKDKNTIYFEEKNNGMLSLCGYVPNGCIDDCFIGITISEIKQLVN